MHFVEKINQGINLLVQNGHAEVVKWMLEKLVADFPDNASMHHQLAIISHKLTDNNTAAVHFKKAAELAPQSPTIQKSFGDFLHVSQGQVENAIEQYDRALNLNPTDLETLLTVAHLYVSLHQFETASQYYERVLAIDPTHAEAREVSDKLKAQQAKQQSPEQLYQDALSQVEAGNTPGAISSLETVLSIAPEYALAHNDLGVLFYELGDKQKAFTHYQQAVRLEPENATYLKNLADFFFFERNDAHKAMELNVRILKLDPEDIECLMSTGYICTALGLDDDASSFFNCVLDIEPWNKQASQALEQLQTRDMSAVSGANQMDANLYSQAQNSSSAGDKAGAIRLLEQLITQDPTHAMAHNDLGVLYYEQGDKNKALRYYELAHQRDSHNHTFMKNLADFYFVEQGRIQEAMALYVKILKSNNEDVDALMASGMICLALGNNDDARTFFERVVEIEPWNGKAREELERIDNVGQQKMASGNTVIV